MGHMFSQHTPSFFHHDHQFPVAQLDESLLATYQGLEEDGDQKIFVENLCRETAVCQETVKAYESCAERIEGKEGMRMRSFVKHCACVVVWRKLGLAHTHTTQHNTTQHNTTQHNTTQHNTTQHNTTQHNTTQHNTTQHNTTQHNTTQHNTTQLVPTASTST